MTTPEQQSVENNNNFAPATIEKRAKALGAYRTRTLLFNGLLSKDPAERSNASEKITQLIKSWARECYSTETARTGGGEGNVSGVSSPLNNSKTPLSSISPLNSPSFFPDGSSSVSAASPIVDGGSTETFHVVNQMDRQGGDFPQQRRRSSVDENSYLEEGSENDDRETLRCCILQMLRMSIDCPFSDVRYSFNKCLTKLRMMEIPVPAPIHRYPSLYIAPEDILTLEWTSDYTVAQNAPRAITPPGVSPTNSSPVSSNSSTFSEETPRVIQQPLTPSTPLFPTSLPNLPPVGKQPEGLVKKLMIDTFIKLGRLSHFYRVLSYFPTFMERFQESYNSVIRAPAPVSMSWRFYIGIMAASQYKCQYVISKLTDEFLTNGGDIVWLQGLKHAPAKIRKLATLNTILAHQPWLLKTSHIEELVKGSDNPLDNWTISEIVHVILILSTFHSLSSYVLGCGIVPEYDSIGGSYEQPPWASVTPAEEHGIMETLVSDFASGLGVTLEDQPTNSDPIPIPAPNVEPLEVRHTSQLIERLSQRSREDDKLTSFGSVPSDSSYSLSRFMFENIDNVEKDTLDEPEESTAPDTESHDLPLSEDCSRFLDPSVEISYSEFDFKSNEYSMFKLQDYNWETQGVVMVNSFLQGVGEMLDREFAEVRDLTDYRLFHSHNSSLLDTRPLRQAIWYYVLLLNGILQEDYDYRDINNFLNNKRIKTFIKKICCTPEAIKYNDWKSVGLSLREEEKCHINLIAVEARKQAGLVYGLSRVMNWTERKK